ncbi:MAG: DUF3726 domain-containing protein [Rhodobiaceae bacterium]
MSWSLGETAALALKATRGAGLSWGLAEEAAGAVFWLHQRGLPGISALCGYLESCGVATTDDDAACPLVLGTALSDGTHAVPEQVGGRIDLGTVKAPLLLLPFVATIPPGTFWLIAPGSDDTAPDQWHSGWLRGSAPCQLRRGTAGQMAGTRVGQTRLPNQFACCVDRLTGYAHRTYAPATSQSRLAGAGAGLTDND